MQARDLLQESPLVILINQANMSELQVQVPEGIAPGGQGSACKQKEGQGRRTEVPGRAVGCPQKMAGCPHTTVFLRSKPFVSPSLSRYIPPHRPNLMQVQTLQVRVHPSAGVRLGHRGDLSITHTPTHIAHHGMHSTSHRYVSPRNHPPQHLLRRAR